MNDEARALAKKALEKQESKPARPKPPRYDPRDPHPWGAAEEKPARGSEDALDHKAFRRGGFSKAEKRAYAKQRFAEELVQPPKEPPPEWLSNPDLLPRKPPPRKEDK